VRRDGLPCRLLHLFPHNGTDSVLSVSRAYGCGFNMTSRRAVPSCEIRWVNLRSLIRML